MSTIDNPCKIKLVTPADTDLTDASSNPIVTAAVCFGTAGTLVVTDFAGNVTTIASGALAAGIWHPMNVKRIALASTAANIAIQWR